MNLLTYYILYAYFQLINNYIFIIYINLKIYITNIGLKLFSLYLILLKKIFKEQNVNYKKIKYYATLFIQSSQLPSIIPITKLRYLCLFIIMVFSYYLFINNKLIYINLMITNDYVYNIIINIIIGIVLIHSLYLKQNILIRIYNIIRVTVLTDYISNRGTMKIYYIKNFIGLFFNLILVQWLDPNLLNYSTLTSELLIINYIISFFILYIYVFNNIDFIISDYKTINKNLSNEKALSILSLIPLYIISLIFLNFFISYISDLLISNYKIEEALSLTKCHMSNTNSNSTNLITQGDENSLESRSLSPASDDSDLTVRMPYPFNNDHGNPRDIKANLHLRIPHDYRIILTSKTLNHIAYYGHSDVPDMSIPAEGIFLPFYKPGIFTSMYHSLIYAEKPLGQHYLMSTPTQINNYFHEINENFFLNIKRNVLHHLLTFKKNEVIFKRLIEYYYDILSAIAISKDRVLQAYFDPMLLNQQYKDQLKLYLDYLNYQQNITFKYGETLIDYYNLGKTYGLKPTLHYLFPGLPAMGEPEIKEITIYWKWTRMFYERLGKNPLFVSRHVHEDEKLRIMHQITIMMMDPVIPLDRSFLVNGYDINDIPRPYYRDKRLDFGKR